MVQYVDDVGRALTPILFTYMLARYVTSTRFWHYWDTRAIGYLLGAIALVGWSSLIIAVGTNAPPSSWPPAPYVSAVMWLLVCSAGVALVGGYEREQYRARHRAKQRQD